MKMSTVTDAIMIASFIGGVVTGFVLFPDGGGTVCGGGKGCNSGAATIGAGLGMFFAMFAGVCLTSIEKMLKGRPQSRTKRKSAKPDPQVTEAERQAKFLADIDAEMARRRAEHGKRKEEA